MRRAGPWLVLGLGVVLAAAGVGVFWVTNLAPGGGAGWSAYAPLEPGDPAPPGAGWRVLWTRGHLVGAALLVLGLLLLAAVGGWLLGRRSGGRPVSGG
ncbi:hypothetical protein [Modestobacter lapidis]|nr:hypothetical protein [Modestobacter lapidis]